MALTQIDSSMIQNDAITSAKIADGSVGTADIADLAVTPAKLSQKLTLGTSLATTSGTSKDFTSIPSWVNRITIALRGVSTAGLTDLLVQIGSGSVQTTGYVSACGYMGTGSTASVNSSTAGFNMVFGNAAQVASGIMTLVHMGGNVWVQSCAGKLTAALAIAGGGDVALSGALDRIRLTTANGTDAFDAGSVNILFEG